MSDEPKMHVNTIGVKSWWVGSKLHRVDAPAVDYEDSRVAVGRRYKEWWMNGKLHRLDGPAIERDDGHKEWWVNGSMCWTVELWAKMALQHQGIECTKENVEQKIAEAMQQDLF